MTDLSGWTTFILCYFDYVSVGVRKTEHNIAHCTIMYTMIEAKHTVSVQQPRNTSCVNSVEVSIFVCGRSWNILPYSLDTHIAIYIMNLYISYQCIIVLDKNNTMDENFLALKV